MRPSFWAAVGGVITGAAGLAAIYQAVLKPDGIHDATHQLERIVDALHGGIASGASAEEVEALRDSALAIANVAARPLDEPDAFMVRIGEGVFDLPVAQAHDLSLPDGTTLPVTMATLTSAYGGRAGLKIGTERTTLCSGDVEVISDSRGNACRLLLVSSDPFANEARFRWRCQGF